MATELFVVVVVVAVVVVVHNKSYLITDTDHGARQCKYITGSVHGDLRPIIL